MVLETRNSSTNQENERLPTIQPKPRHPSLLHTVRTPKCTTLHKYRLGLKHQEEFRLNLHFMRSLQQWEQVLHSIINSIIQISPCSPETQIQHNNQINHHQIIVNPMFIINMILMKNVAITPALQNIVSPLLQEVHTLIKCKYGVKQSLALGNTIIIKVCCQDLEVRWWVSMQIDP